IALGTNNRSAGDLPVGALMKKDISTCAPEDDIRTTLRTMARRQIQRLPVVDTTGVLQGIVSIDDIVVPADADGVPSDDVLTTIKAICGRQVQRKADDMDQS